MCSDVKTFYLQRHKDVSGTSGCGKVAVGCVFQDTGEAVVHWLGEHSCTNFYKSVEDIVWIHGHGAATELIFTDEPDNKNK